MLATLGRLGTGTALVLACLAATAFILAAFAAGLWVLIDALGPRDAAALRSAVDMASVALPAAGLFGFLVRVARAR